MKGSGDTRASKWAGDIYSVDGVRYEYHDLKEHYPAQAEAVLKELKSVSNAMNKALEGKEVDQVIDGNKPIKIVFTSRGNSEFARQSLLTLSGKYFSRNSMLHVDEILTQAEYVPTGHRDIHGNPNALWFAYKDSQGRGVWFKVRKDLSRNGQYALYSVTDDIKAVNRNKK